MLAPSTYTSLLETIDAALKATPPPAGSQRGANNFRAGDVAAQVAVERTK